MAQQVSSSRIMQVLITKQDAVLGNPNYQSTKMNLKTRDN